MATTVLYILTPQYILCVYSLPSTPTATISLTSTMLTCKTPLHGGIPSKQPVKLTVDSVERHAPVQFTYNQDPIINSIQPSRSFVRLVVFIQNGVFNLKAQTHQSNIDAAMNPCLV